MRVLRRLLAAAYQWLKGRRVKSQPAGRNMERRFVSDIGSVFQACCIYHAEVREMALDGVVLRCS